MNLDRTFCASPHCRNECGRQWTAELQAAQKECEEQARLNGMGAEREAKLLTENARLRKALEFYGDMENYSCGITGELTQRVIRDNGQRAREALR